MPALHCLNEPPRVGHAQEGGDLIAEDEMIGDLFVVALFFAILIAYAFYRIAFPDRYYPDVADPQVLHELAEEIRARKRVEKQARREAARAVFPGWDETERGGKRIFTPKGERIDIPFRPDSKRMTRFLSGEKVVIAQSWWYNEDAYSESVTLLSRDNEYAEALLKISSSPRFGKPSVTEEIIWIPLRALRHAEAAWELAPLEDRGRNPKFGPLPPSKVPLYD